VSHDRDFKYGFVLAADKHKQYQPMIAPGSRR